MVDEESSKSARKREAQRLKGLGQQLANLNDEQRAGLRLPANIAKAVADYRQITSHEAKRRQGQYIGRLMRGIDVAELEQALANLTRSSGLARFEHHEVERWRERLLAQDDALLEYLERYPATNRQQLRALIKSTRSRPGDAAAFRVLFRFLRDNAAGHAALPDEASVPPTVT
jgi:ribosome-associated protein